MSAEPTEKIIEVHRILGPGLLASIFEEALCHELQLSLFTEDTETDER